MSEIRETLWKDYENVDNQIKDCNLSNESRKELLEERDKIRNELIKLKQIDKEENVKLEVMKSEDKREKVRNGISLCTFVITTGVSIYAILRTFKFDQTGTITSTLGHNILNGMVPKFKK